MAVDQKSRQMRAADPTRAGQPVAVHHEYLVRNRAHLFEFRKKILMMEPAYAATIAVHQPDACHGEDPGAQPAKRHPGRGGAAQEGGLFR